MADRLNLVQEEILKAMEQMSEKASYTEFVLAKKIRQNTGIEGKKKAGIGLEDLLIVIDVLAERNLFYSLHVNSVNDILIRKETAPVEISVEAKRRRRASEKSMSLFTPKDFTKK